MQRRGFSGHVNPHGLGPQERVDHAGLQDFSCGENIMHSTDATSDTPEEIAGKAFTGWLNSPGHYENLTSPQYDTGGIGVFVKPKLLFRDAVPRRYDIYVTHLLCRNVSQYNRLKREYDKLRPQLDTAETLYNTLRAEHERLKVEYEQIEARHVRNTAPYAEVEAAYKKLETARIRLNAQTEQVDRLVKELNKLVEQMNIAAGP
jgi:hypothetical protein